MEYNIIFRLADYYLSFLPLWISAAIANGYYLYINVCDNRLSKVWLVTTSLLLFASVAVFYKFMSHTQVKGRKFELIYAKEEKAISSEYLISVVLPLCTFDLTKSIDVILFLVYFLFLGWLTIIHKNLNSSVILEMIGYKFYECNLQNSDNREIKRIIISKDNLTLREGEDILLRTINNEVLYYETPQKINSNV